MDGQNLQVLHAVKIAEAVLLHQKKQRVIAAAQNLQVVVEGHHQTEDVHQTAIHVEGDKEKI